MGIMGRRVKVDSIQTRAKALAAVFGVHFRTAENWILSGDAKGKIAEWLNRETIANLQRVRRVKV